jgi:hypothetical protein
MWTTRTSSTSKLNFLLVETTQETKQAQIPPVFSNMHSLFRFCRRFVHVRLYRTIQTCGILKRFHKCAFFADGQIQGERATRSASKA